MAPKSKFNQKLEETPVDDSKRDMGEGIKHARGDANLESRKASAIAKVIIEKGVDPELADDYQIRSKGLRDRVAEFSHILSVLAGRENLK